MLPLFRTRSDRTASKTAESRARRPRRQQLGLEALEGRQLLSLGGEFLVNSNVEDNQRTSANASSADGSRSVVVWLNEMPTNDNDVFFRLYDSNGNPINEFNIDASVLDAQGPSVAMDANGDFVVTWQRELSNGNEDIVMRRFDRNGNPTSSLIKVTNTAEDERFPDVAMDSIGNIVVTFERFTILASGQVDGDVIAQRYDNQLVPSGTIPVATSDTVRETDPAVAMTPDGRFAIAYQRGNSNLNSKGDIRLARFSSTGGSLGSHVQITNTSTVSEVDPDVAMDNAGNAVVVYQEVGQAGGFTDFNIKARRVNSFGVKGRNVINVATSTTLLEEDPFVAMHPTSRSFVVAYEARPIGGGQGSTRVAEFSGADSLVARHTNFFLGDKQAAVSIAGDGDFLVTYTGDNVNDTTDIFGRRGRLA